MPHRRHPGGPKLDRLARSLPDARDIVEELTTRGVRLQLDGSVHDPTDPVGRLLFNVLAMVAEFESDLIKARTREGLAVARAAGKLRGRKPKLTPARASDTDSRRPLRRRLLLRVSAARGADPPRARIHGHPQRNRNVSSPTSHRQLTTTAMFTTTMPPPPRRVRAAIPDAPVDPLQARRLLLSPRHPARTTGHRYWPRRRETRPC